MKIAILWHMHQPDYRDEKGVFTLPWVFLHAIKDYYDMPYIAAQYNVKVSFNLTPILIEQLRDYIQKGPSCDRILQLFLKKTDFLTKEEKNTLQKVCKTVHPQTMGYGLNHRFFTLIEKEDLDDEELNDLEVYFLLSWCGNYLRNTNSFIQSLLRKSGYTQEEKEHLIQNLFSFLPSILPFYRKLQDDGKIAVSTTPYSHPILPLLLDINVAKEANPSITLPKQPLSLQDDAILHIQKAKELYKTVFGKEPKGFWPAEGAVDEKSVTLYKQENIAWIATDEAILYKSEESDKYSPYAFEGVKIFFRDHELSDLLGFVYKDFPADKAVEDFSQRLPQKGSVFIILDGENAWEYYPKNGWDFLNALYAMLEEKDTLTYDEAATLQAKPLKRLAPGSWIYGNFDTWIGDEEKNRAWELLFQTKRDSMHHAQDTFVQHQFLLAETSDWFWWYGYGHYTEFAQEFDTLFRSHLMAIYKHLGINPPQDIRIPIVGAHSMQAIINEPRGYIYPIIDGKVTSFFEWLDSGYLDEKSSTMQSNFVIQKLFWGENESSIFFRMDGDGVALLDCRCFFDEDEVQIKRVAKDEIIEIEIDKKSCQKKEFEVRIEIFKEKRLLQILPSTTRLYIRIDNDYTRYWFV
ncbi:MULTISPECIES: glycoside hydrolase family 57 protein [unclassified Nitratiruptor]|uniref:glycoside hydrolase family 57 protein n=1 Tax=unclassified Nitratiruptor TaxID=2624044 RepID=UPI001915D9BD|nr:MULTISPECIES: glycoside hydrolase family 57 protein [unclassified Nitratiruptor]BCD60342.1 glycoside hydrolase family 57 [Nitratiruptor sp. YY08-10]BCD64169.1 glycoside hydrolase family 57 [Nitratiruptor sp. YY08-14]